ncbi:MAG: PAS domain S-box protein [Peptococcaceae bacterium]|jgi:PAS domain S-box-containing protein|nr:PAS domain S-box protein [Peptococcaceae bacterium]
MRVDEDFERSLMDKFGLPADAVAEVRELVSGEYWQEVAQYRRELAELEEGYRRALEMSASAIGIHQDGKVVFVNDSAVRTVGATSSADMVGRGIFDFIHPDSRAKVRERIDKITKEDVGVGVIDEKFVARDGSVFAMEVAAAPVTYMGKPAIAIVAENETLCKDVVDLFREMSDNSPSGIAIIQDRKFRYVNRMIQKMSGCSEEELLGSGSLTFALAADRQKVRRTSARILAGERPGPHVYRAANKNGGILWVMESMAQIQYNGRPAILANFMDVSEIERLRR